MIKFFQILKNFFKRKTNLHIENKYRIYDEPLKIADKLDAELCKICEDVGCRNVNNHK